MKVIDQNIVMESGKTVDGRDLSVDGAFLDKATYRGVPNTLVLRDNTNYADLLSSASLKLNTPRKITLLGDIEAESQLFDGTADISFNVTVKNYEHNHNSVYYTKEEIDTKISSISLQPYELAPLRGGQGMKFFNYNGTINTTVEVAFAGSGGDWGTEFQFVARSDHKHDNDYLRNVSVSNNNIVITKGDGSTANIRAPWALRLGWSRTSGGLSLNSTEVNNEPNKVVRTDASGNVQFSNIILGSGTTTDPISYVYVDTGDNALKKAAVSTLFSQFNVSGNNVTQHGHTRLYATSDTSKWISHSWNGTYWRLNGSDSKGVSVAHADLSSGSYYADLAELYTVKNASKIKEGTVLSVCTKSKWELEQCDLECSGSIVGVISSKPGFILNDKDSKKKNALPVCLKGKNPVRIVGKISKGDPIVSFGNGAARKIRHNSELHFSFGIALESSDADEEKLVYCFIK